MISPALSKAIEDDLFNELRWLLCAATEWAAQRVPTIKEPCKHLKVYTMDSAFTHARGLYEFFTMERKSVLNHDRQNHKRLTWHSYGLTAPLASQAYKKRFAGPLHGRVMHICLGRSAHRPIKDKVVTLAADILDLWDRFSKHPDLKDYASLLDEKRKEAIDEAKAVAAKYAPHGFKCPFC